MKRQLAALLIVLAPLTGCSTHDASRPNALVAVENQYLELRQQDKVKNHAAIELEELAKHLEHTNDHYQEDNSSDFQHSLYMARRQADIVEAVANKGHYEEQIRLSREKREALNRQQLEQALMKQTAVANSAHSEAQALAAQLEHVKSKLTERGTVLSLQDILFEFDKAELKPGAERTIAQLANFLNNRPELEVMIEGFTDALGEDAYNQTLSLKRAQAVMAALEQHGVPVRRMEAKGLGEEFPVASNDDPSGRQQNRRVEILFANEPG